MDGAACERCTSSTRFLCVGLAPARDLLYFCRARVTPHAAATRAHELGKRRAPGEILDYAFLFETANFFESLCERRFCARGWAHQHKNAGLSLRLARLGAADGAPPPPCAGTYITRHRHQKTRHQICRHTRSTYSPFFYSHASLPHPQVEVSPKGVALVRMDVQGEKQNTFNDEFYQDMSAMVEKVESDDSIKAVVLSSGKPGSWIAGANIKQIEEIKSAEQASDGRDDRPARHEPRLQHAVAKKPWIAAIDGACLGGGLEMAMTCSQRIASSSPKTVLGVPEVMLGLLPGWGGTQRLPKIVGAANALDLMLDRQDGQGRPREEDGPRGPRRRPERARADGRRAGGAAGDGIASRRRASSAGPTGSSRRRPWAVMSCSRRRARR